MIKASCILLKKPHTTKKTNFYDTNLVRGREENKQNISLKVKLLPYQQTVSRNEINVAQRGTKSAVILNNKLIIWWLIVLV